MIAANYHLKKVVLRCLENNMASLQQDKDGRNIGMYAVSNRLEDVAIKALDNKEASLQQDFFGNNIGMWAALWKLKNVAMKSMENKAAATQKNLESKTILYIAKENGLIKFDNEEVKVM